MSMRIITISILFCWNVATAAEPHLLNGYDPRDNAGNLRMVVEIPAGTNEKWEVEKNTGTLLRDFEDGKPRTVEYLPYPGNYGMVPRTLLPKSNGGDGDPLDVVLLAPALPRGSVVTVKPIALLYLYDRGEIDHKIVAVSTDSPLADIDDLAALESHYPGIAPILAIWFSNYKGPGKMKADGFGDAEAAQAFIKQTISAFTSENP
jgi:inorganic pyrophosphatase